jgi:predicted dehydrogenase
MVEKPMTLASAEAAELTDLAQLRGRVLMVGHLLEYHPAVLYIKNMIETGQLGQVYYLYSQRLNFGTVRNDENAWWSLAPHDISVACRLLGGWPVSVQCRGQNVVQSRVADVVFATLEFPGGRLAHMHVSWLDPHKTRKLTVVGSKRMVVFDDTLASYKVTVYEKDFRLNRPETPQTPWITLQQGDVLIPRLDATEPLLLEARHYVDCIRKGRQPISDGASGTMVVSVLEHGQRSLETGAVVPLPAPPTTELRLSA